MIALLPPHAEDPAGGESVFGPSVGALAREAVRRLETELLDGPSLKLALEPLAHGLAGFALGASAALEAAAVSYEASRACTLTHREHEQALTLEQYCLYDEQFGIRRRAGITCTVFSAQIVVTGLRLVQDLPRCLLGRGQLSSLLRGLEGMLSEFGGKVEAAPLRPPPLEGDTALFRWRNGHHFFGLASHMGRLALERCSVDIERAPALLEEAIRYLRCTGAAMAYATDFPSKMYTETIRPSLLSAAMPGGFSGSQNSDYNHFKLAKGALIKALVARYGAEAEAWPEDLAAALRRLRLFDELDIDQHILVAAEKIGLEPSLHQLDQGETHSAVRALRRIQEQRAHEFSRIREPVPPAQASDNLG